QSELLRQTREQAQQEALINHIAQLLHSPRNMREILQLVLEQIVQTTHASGGRLYLTATDKIPVELYTCGTQPTVLTQDKPNLLEANALWQHLMQHLNQSSQADDFSDLRVITDLYQDPHLDALTAAFQPTPIRGILVLSLRYGQESLGCLTLFRNAIDTETLWAGYWERDERQQRPRESFEIWREFRKNQALDWTREDIELIESLGIHLAMAVMQNRLYQLEMHNRELNIARVAAEESNRLKSNLLASTSHELRTPLASTLNFLQILKKGFYKNEGELKKYIQLAEQSARNLVAIINDILDIAKIEAGRMSVELEPVSLKPLLEEQRDLFTPESQRKAIPLIIECEVDSVYADKGKLRQVLTNLLSNALKFTEKGEIRIRSIKPVDKPIVEITVTDTGIGIDMNKQELLFEPFVQENGSIKRRYGGTGLGLAICKQFVELMGGQIRLDSPGKGRGTTVRLLLPYSPNSAQHQTQVSS
ncbi:MAG: histidine kinase, partial [Coleofasciculus sp. S288]|nr:histidine kinase [Coleofasciculus sp. S288]